MSVESPDEFSVVFVGECGSCGRNRQHSMPGYERFQNNSDGIWSYCPNCRQENWLTPK